MRFVVKDLDDQPDIFLKQRTLDDLEEIAQNLRFDLIKDRIYKDTYTDAKGKTQSRVRDKLNDYYLKKCAYCELFCKAEIEHYRPKKGVIGDKNHKGYYWLCYEWSNLVPSCRYCNTEGGKGNQFPIKNVRVTAPVFDVSGKIDKTHSLANHSTLQSEKPYLLHPEIDNPAQFLTFRIGHDKKGIEIVGIDTTTQRGQQTIKICNLNRDDLQLARLKNVIEPILNSINNMFELLRKETIVNSKLGDALGIVFKQAFENSLNTSKEHTLLRQTVVKNINSFDELIVSQLEPNQKLIVKTAFQSYLNRHAT